MSDRRSRLDGEPLLRRAPTLGERGVVRHQALDVAHRHQDRQEGAEHRRAAGLLVAVVRRALHVERGGLPLRRLERGLVLHNGLHRRQLAQKLHGGRVRRVNRHVQALLGVRRQVRQDVRGEGVHRRRGVRAEHRRRVAQGRALPARHARAHVPVVGVVLRANGVLQELEGRTQVALRHRAGGLAQRVQACELSRERLLAELLQVLSRELGVVRRGGGRHQHRELREAVQRRAGRELAERLVLLRAGADRQARLLKGADRVHRHRRALEQVLRDVLVTVHGQRDRTVAHQPLREAVQVLRRLQLLQRLHRRHVDEALAPLLVDVVLRERLVHAVRRRLGRVLRVRRVRAGRRRRALQEALRAEAGLHGVERRLVDEGLVVDLLAVRQRRARRHQVAHVRALAGVLDRARDARGLHRLVVQLRGHHGVRAGRRRHQVRHHLLQLLSHLAAAREVHRRALLVRKQLPLARHIQRRVRREARRETLLLQQLHQALEPPVHVLRRVVARQHHHRHARLEVPQHLLRQVEEVREVRHAADERRVPVHRDLARSLVLEQRVHQAALDDGGLRPLLDLREAVLLLEVHRLGNNQLRRLLHRQELVLDAADLLAVVLHRRVHRVEVVLQRLEAGTVRVHHLTVLHAERVDRLHRRSARHDFAVEHRRHRVRRPRRDVEALQQLNRALLERRLGRRRRQVAEGGPHLRAAKALRAEGTPLACHGRRPESRTGGRHS
eukprot:Rhum_TRINITY_DN15354_c8_g1::Rhum_TRINITY_DN15354_c8_g1_i5::g.154077::m.154077